MKKTELIAINYDGDLASSNYFAAAERIGETVIKLLEVLANTDPVYCKSLLGQINAQLTGESLAANIQERSDHKESVTKQMLEGMGESMLMKFEPEEGEEAVSN